MLAALEFYVSRCGGSLDQPTLANGTDQGVTHRLRTPSSAGSRCGSLGSDFGIVNFRPVEPVAASALLPVLPFLLPVRV